MVPPDRFSALLDITGRTPPGASNIIIMIVIMIIVTIITIIVGVGVGAGVEVGVGQDRIRSRIGTIIRIG